MTVTVKFSCGGCDATAPGTTWLKREFRSVSGRSYGIGGSVETTGVLDVVPEGWIAFDPYTYCTYCPTCWKSIQESDSPNQP